MPADVAALPTQLRLARHQNAYLHRELATALKQGPLAPSSLASEAEALRAENTDLRERLNTLTRHYDDLQRRYQGLRHSTERLQKDLDAIRTAFVHSHPGTRSAASWLQPTLVEVPATLDHVLTRLLTIAHPDKWDKKPATELAPELSVAINQVREHEGRRA